MLYLYYKQDRLSKREINLIWRTMMLGLNSKVDTDTEIKTTLLSKKMADKLWSQHVYPWSKKNKEVFNQLEVKKARNSGTDALSVALINAWLEANFESFSKMKSNVVSRVNVSTNYQVRQLERSIVIGFEADSDMEQLLEMLD